MLGIVLTRFQSFFGMPKQELFYLALGAVAFSIYSLTCFFLFPKNWKPYLQLIAILNILYCCVTLVLVFILKSELTAWGVAYFVGEIILICFIAWMEIKTTLNNFIL